jgi:hypothetical protein
MAEGTQSRLETIVEYKEKGLSKIRAELSKTSASTAKYANDSKKQIDKKTESIRKLQIALKKAGIDFQGMNRAQMIASIKSYKSTMRTVTALSRVQKGVQMVNNAFLGLGLTLLFGGMAIKNFFQNIARGFVNSYMLVTGQTSNFSQSVAKLQGSWEYLKYSIMSALERAGVIDWVVEKVKKLIDYVTQLSDSTKTKIGIAVIALIGLGAIAMVVGQAFLIAMAPLTLFNMALQTYILLAETNAGRKLITNLALLGKGFFGVLWNVIKLTAIFAAWLALFALVAALGISIGLIWKNIFKALKIRWKQIKIIVDQIVDSWMYRFKMFKELLHLLTYSFKKVFLEVLNTLSSKMADFVNGAIEGYNKVNGLLPDITWRAEAIAVDTAGLDEKINASRSAMEDLSIDFERRQKSRDIAMENTKYALELNREDAGEALKEGWSTIIDGLKNKTGEFKERVFGGDTTNNKTENTNSGNTVQVTNNINLQAGADYESEMDKLLKAQDDAYIKYFGSTASQD